MHHAPIRIDLSEQDKIAVSLLDTAITRARMSTVAMVFGVVTLAGMGLSVGVTWIPAAMVVLACMAAAWRVVAAKRWQRLVDRVAARQRYQRGFRIIVGLLSGAHVLALIFIYPLLSVQLGVLMLLVMVGALSVAVMSVSLVRWGMTLYFLPPLLATMLASALDSRSESLWMMVVVPVYGLIMFRAGRDHFEQATRTIQQQLELERALKALEIARLAAEAGNRAKSQFLATMSHEIRTPMNGMLGLLDMIDDGSLTPRQLRWVRMARSSGSGLIDVINDVLDYSKLEAGKVTLHRAPFALGETITTAVGLFEPSAVGKGVSLCHELAPDLPLQVIGDAVRLRQVLLNLIGNAVKFTDQGGIVVAAVALPDPKNSASCQLRVSVTDSGIGMASTRLAELFQPFHQLDQSDTRAYGGSGLGLAICKRLADEMQGQIDVESTVGQGSRFTFTVPLDIDTRAVATVPATSGDALTALSVLVAEDSELSRLVLTSMCDKLDMAVVEACDGVEAVECWRRGGIDVILMDCQMPRQDGFDATAEIRREEELRGLPRTPIIAVTANALAGDRERCLAAGMDDYMSKPVSFSRLKTMLESWGGIDHPVPIVQTSGIDCRGV